MRNLCAEGLCVGNVGGKDGKRSFTAIASGAGPIRVDSSAQTGLHAEQTKVLAAVAPAIAAFERHARLELEVAVGRRSNSRRRTECQHEQQGRGFHCPETLGSAHMP